MYKMLHTDDLKTAPSRTARFEGEAYGSGVSFFLVNNDPGQGPVLHRHPYSETWVVLCGEALFTADEMRVDARKGDVLVVGAGTPHKFCNTGTGRLELMCIHASPRIIQEDLE
jgi:mannose-6-phosphate isomerase-like protein (cupin superfamily)